MWVLCLNDMRASNIENLQPVCRADTREQLESLLHREAVEPYRDGQWGKSFRAGGPLEWFNPPFAGDDCRHFQNAGTADDWARAAIESFNSRVMWLPVF
jgi:hypothetical protein